MIRIFLKKVTLKLIIFVNVVVILSNWLRWEIFNFNHLWRYLKLDNFFDSHFLTNPFSTVIFLTKLFSTVILSKNFSSYRLNFELIKFSKNAFLNWSHFITLNLSNWKIRSVREKFPSILISNFLLSKIWPLRKYNLVEKPFVYKQIVEKLTVEKNCRKRPL